MVGMLMRIPPGIGHRQSFPRAEWKSKLVWTTVIATTMMPGMNIHLPRKGSRQARFDSLAQEVYLNLWRTYDRLRALEDELFATFDLTAQQYNALRLLRGAHPETLRTLVLANRLVSRAPDITRLLDRLEERGLVARERRRDNRRVVEVGITES